MNRTHSSPEQNDASLWFNNTWVSIHRSAHDGPDGLAIIEHRLPCGDSPPLHVHHHEDEVFHVLSGTLQLRVGDEELTAQAGQTVVAPKGIAHSYRALSPEGVHCVTVTTGRGFETLVRSVSRPAGAATLPEPAVPTPEQIAVLAGVAASNGIDLVGPPL
jgi:quercetin dioxygenase-like cupin family protein